MNLRVTLQSLVNNSLAETQQQNQTLAQLQAEAATGKRIVSPSDDPIGSEIVSANNTQESRLQAYLDTINTAQTSLNLNVSTLQSVSNLLIQAHGIAVEGSQSTNDQSARDALATQIDAVLNNVLGLANTQSDGDYIYSGTSSQTKPYVVASTNAQGEATQVTYQGGSGTPQTIVAAGQTVNLALSGQDVFQAQGRQATVYGGTTGAAAGTGVDSAVGTGNLLVTHTATTYAAGSGVQAGSSSASGDTIIGPAGAYTLTINDTSGTGSSGTVSLNNGPPVNFTSSDTNLAVTGTNGQVVYLDTSAITPGFNGSVAVTATGSLSIDGGATSTPIDFSGNQQLVDSKTGAVTNVDSSNIRLAGSDNVRYPGTGDTFQVLMQLRDDLRNTSGVSETQQLQNISSDIAEVDRVNNGVLNEAGSQSALLLNLGDLKDHTTDMQLATQETVSNLQDADMSQVVVQYQAQQTMYQITLATISHLFDQTLLSYLQ